jgi:hypothetical protein
MKAYWDGGIAPYILDLGTGWELHSFNCLLASISYLSKFWL